MTRLLTSFGLSFALGLVGCSESHGACLPGTHEACGCPGGEVGVQRCLPDATYDACYCPSPSNPAGDGDGDGDGFVGDGWDGADGDGDGTNARDAGTPSYDGVELAHGTGTLLEVFGAGDAIWVVDSTGVSKFAFDAAPESEPLARWDAPRNLVAAAFDGERIAVADGARVTVLAADSLAQQVDSNVVESCASLAFVSAARLVCGPDTDWQRVFYTYDALTLALLASSQEFYDRGLSMRTVPGADAFVTAAGDFSSDDFHLYRLTETGEISHAGQSPYQSDVEGSDIYSFQGEPASHVITHRGLLLDLGGCTGEEDASCFVKDGALGTLPKQGEYLGMAATEQGLFTVVRTSSDGYQRCQDAPCQLERIDVAAREVRQSASFRRPLDRIVRLVPSADGREVVLGARLPGDPFATEGRGYIILRLAFE